ncbi:MAG TPA: Hsp20/alpha crystallin family protein [Flavitalea sp.]|nr:Hsp20/alpha crystallin family protein [Flavitalea sp.]
MRSGNLPSIRHSSIYPGEYEAPPWTGAAMIAECNRNQLHCLTSQANVIEAGDHYKVEIIAPGFNREDFTIHSAFRKLSISAVRNENSGRLENHGRFSGPSLYLQNEVILPEDMDTNYVRAEYRNGVLTISFFRTERPETSGNNQIVVY